MADDASAQLSRLKAELWDLQNQRNFLSGSGWSQAAKARALQQIDADIAAKKRQIKQAERRQA